MRSCTSAAIGNLRGTLSKKGECTIFTISSVQAHRNTIEEDLEVLPF
jgi:hypothetical protein